MKVGLHRAENEAHHRSHSVAKELSEGESKMKGSKWPSKLRIQISIIVVLVFIIWIFLQNPARWG
jgi:hypothetical protein